MILISKGSNRLRFIFNYFLYLGGSILGFSNFMYLLANITEISDLNFHSKMQLILLQSTIVFFIFMLAYLVYKINELEDLLLKIKDDK